MEITGRITADATVKTVNTDKEVVNFSIAINDRYKKKGEDEFTEVATFFNCAYWLNAKLAEHLKKGAIVQLSGRIGMDVYINSSGDAAGNLTFHTNTVKILSFGKKQEEAPAQTAKGSRKADTKKVAAGDNDDLPF